MPEQYLHQTLTEKIIKAFYKVYNTLGYGFLEKVYENALVIELREMGLQVEQQKLLKVFTVNTSSANILLTLLLRESFCWNSKRSKPCTPRITRKF